MNMATGETKPVKDPPIKAIAALSLEYDPESKMTLAWAEEWDANDKRIGSPHLLAYDPDKDEWTEVQAAGQAPRGDTQFDVMVYDTDHRCHLVLNVLGVQGGEHQGGRIDGVFAIRFAKPASGS